MSIGAQTQKTKAGADGKWTVKLGKLSVGEPVDVIPTGVPYGAAAPR